MLFLKLRLKLSLCLVTHWSITATTTNWSIHDIPVQNPSVEDFSAADLYTLSLHNQSLIKLENWLVFNYEREDVLGRHDAPVRCIEYSYATGYALSSVEGRVAMEFFDLSEAGQSKKYAFKCHRKSEAGRDIFYPVNAIAFHPVHEPDAIFVHSINEVEVKPKPKVYPNPVT